MGVYHLNVGSQTVTHTPSGFKIAIEYMQGQAADANWAIDSNYSTKSAKIRNAHGLSQQLAGLFLAKGIHLPKANSSPKPKADHTAALAADGGLSAGGSGQVQSANIGSAGNTSRQLQLVQAEDGLFRLAAAKRHIHSERDDSTQRSSRSSYSRSKTSATEYSQAAESEVEIPETPVQVRKKRSNSGQPDSTAKEIKPGRRSTLCYSKKRPSASPIHMSKSPPPRHEQGRAKDWSPDNIVIGAAPKSKATGASRQLQRDFGDNAEGPPDKFSFKCSF